MTVFSIACIQTDYGLGDNVEAMTRDLGKVMRRYPWVEMVMFPELAAFGPNSDNAQVMPGSAEAQICALAAKYAIWLLPGSMYELSGKDIYNTASVINPQGEVVGRYRKMYPFAPYEQGISSGQEFLVFDVPDVGRFGVSICYDMWFPETTRALAWLGAEVILHPTLTNTIDRDSELAIARASAITNQCYFLDVNCGGDLGYGKSILLGPEGDILHQADRAGEFMPVDLDLERVRRVRNKGHLNLGQLLKSFRDGEIDYPQYRRGARSPVLDNLGPLALTCREGR